MHTHRCVQKFEVTKILIKEINFFSKDSLNVLNHTTDIDNVIKYLFNLMLFFLLTVYTSKDPEKVSHFQQNY